MYYVIDYVDNLMENTLQFCINPDKPALPSLPPPLDSTYTHPNKDSIPLFSRYEI